ncbi:hypothetical protein KJ039_03365 [bacterium]|nr:hypothetical protein [bacterium]
MSTIGKGGVREPDVDGGGDRRAFSLLSRYMPLLGPDELQEGKNLVRLERGMGRAGAEVQRLQGEKNMYEILNKLKADLAVAEMRLFEEAKRVYPVGCLVRFRRGRSTIEAEVLDHLFFHTPSLKVRNLRSGKESRVSIFGFEPTVIRAMSLKL